MNRAEEALREIQNMRELQTMDSPIHGLAPLLKLLVTIFYILIVMSFAPYNLSGLFVMLLFPVLAYQISGIPLRTCFYKLRFVLPLVCAVGLFNPFLDRRMVLIAGTFAVRGGVISMITLMLKGCFCLMASFLLIATTSIEEICLALRQLHVPKLLTALLLLTYRYVEVLLRAPGQKGIAVSAWGSFLGQLLLRSMDRAEDLYESMELRGFTGEFYYAERQKSRENKRAGHSCASKKQNKTEETGYDTI